jgi:hypothetical protein
LVFSGTILFKCPVAMHLSETIHKHRMGIENKSIA